MVDCPQKLPLYFLILLALLMPFVESAADRGTAHAAPAHAGPSAPQTQGVTEDYSEAMLWYNWRAEQGHVDAQFYLGLMHALGKGVPRDYEKAAMWYRKAADQGYADARFELGRLYAVGDGVPQDLIQAYIWTGLAADQGHGKAVEILEILALQMSPAQLAEAQQSLRKMLPKKQQ